jgi:hypothetical protein
MGGGVPEGRHKKTRTSVADRLNAVAPGLSPSSGAIFGAHRGTVSTLYAQVPWSGGEYGLTGHLYVAHPAPRTAFSHAILLLHYEYTCQDE